MGKTIIHVVGSSSTIIQFVILIESMSRKTVLRTAQHISNKQTEFQAPPPPTISKPKGFQFYRMWPSSLSIKHVEHYRRPGNRRLCPTTL